MNNNVLAVISFFIWIVYLSTNGSVKTLTKTQNSAAGADLDLNAKTFPYLYI